jgi:monoamine oxidase
MAGIDGSLHVLVAGAGLAGLAAARDLERRGARVTVIEARDRVGGRAWTIRDGLHGQHAEAGADMIEGEQTEVLALARSLGLRTPRILRHGFGFYGRSPRGRIGVQKLDSGRGALLQPFVEAVRAFQLSEDRWDSAIAADLSRHSVAGWLARTGAPDWVRARLKGLRGFFLADPEDLSALAVVELFAESGPPGTSTMYRIADGNDRLATRIAGELRRPPHLNTILRRVRAKRRTVTATVEHASGLSEIAADFLIVAVPATCAREVVFDSDLPEAQQDAMRALRYGAATRVLLQFSDRFWNRAGRPTAFGTDGPLGAVWDGNEQQRGPAILTLLGGGNASRELQALVRDEPAAILPHLRWLGRPARLLASRVIVWDTDPWVRGGYAYFHAGFDPRLRDWLARPAGRILFAGEHTSQRWQGYLNGAVVSGLRAAAEVAALASR